MHSTNKNMKSQTYKINPDDYFPKSDHQKVKTKYFLFYMPLFDQILEVIKSELIANSHVS